MRYQEDKSLPLHKTVHWRKIKSIICELCKYEQVNLSNYDINRIICYNAVGNEMKGKNVHYNTQDNNSIWVSDNKYDIFEAPNSNNSSKFKFAGSFLFLAHNKSWDYWLFGKMTDSTKLTVKGLTEKVEFVPYGKYIIASNNKKISIRKEVNGYQLKLGAHTIGEDTPYFDGYYR